MKKTTHQRIQQAVTNAGRQARSAGMSEAQVQAAMIEARELHSDPRYQAHVDAMEAEQEKADKLDATMDERREWLDRRHREALRESPYSTFVSRIPIGQLAKLSPQEREQLDAFERQAFARHQPMAQAREQQRRAFIAAGGEAAAFDDIWELGGKDAHAAQVAEEILERVQREDPVF